MNRKLKKLDTLIELALKDGEVTEKERKVILNKAQEYKIDIDEAEMYLDAKVYDYEHEPIKSESISENETDLFNITDEELLLRCQKWVNIVDKPKIKIEVEDFPTTNKKINLENAINLGKDILDIAKDFTPAALPSAAIGITKGIAKSINPFSSSKRTLKQNEIIEIADKYLLILEYRKNRSDVLEKRYNDFQNIKNSKLNK